MLEVNKLYNIDCLDGMKEINDKSIDMILCDLPYGTTQCKWDTVIPFEPLWEQYNRIIKDNGAIVLFRSQPFTSNLIMSNISNFKYCIIWEKSKATGFLNAKKRPMVAHEDICVFYKKQCTYNPQMVSGNPYNKGVRKKQTEDDVYGEFDQVEVKSDGLRYPRSVQYFKTAESEGVTYHKTQKPVALCEYLIRTYTDEGDLILDNCGGSMTTAVAAINTGRNYICMENNKEIFETGKSRIDALKV